MNKSWLIAAFGFLIASWSMAGPNPSALYCEQLGYAYRMLETPTGTRGMVVVGPGVEFDAWDFFKGKVGSEYAYGARHGYDTVCWRETNGACITESAVCVKAAGTGDEVVIPLLDLMAQNGDSLFFSSPLRQPGEGTPTGDPFTLPVNRSLPTSFDWRDVGGKAYIGGVHD